MVQDDKGKDKKIILFTSDITVTIKFNGNFKNNHLQAIIEKNMRSKGIGKQLLNFVLNGEESINEQNPRAVGFYEYMGVETYKRTDLDEEGNIYPLLYMNLK